MCAISYFLNGYILKSFPSNTVVENESFLMNQVTTKPIVIYPNSGESYDADLKEWVVSSFCNYLCLLFSDISLVEMNVFFHSLSKHFFKKQVSENVWYHVSLLS